MIVGLHRLGAGVGAALIAFVALAASPHFAVDDAAPVSHSQTLHVQTQKQPRPVEETIHIVGVVNAVSLSSFTVSVHGGDFHRLRGHDLVVVLTAGTTISVGDHARDTAVDIVAGDRVAVDAWRVELDGRLTYEARQIRVVGRSTTTS